MYILAIEASGDISTIALAEKNKIISRESISTSHKNSVYLVPKIFDLLRQTNILPRELSAVVVNKGPGSFTGVRLSLSAAIGVAKPHNIPIVCPDSFDIIAMQAKDSSYLMVIGSGYGFISSIDKTTIVPQVVLNETTPEQSHAILNSTKIIANKADAINVPCLQEAFKRCVVTSAIVDANQLIKWYHENLDNLDKYMDLAPLYLHNPYIRKG